MSWLTNLFCRHKWVVIAQGELFVYGVNKGPWYACRCEHCGAIKRVTP